jgi:hypothetical protein
MRPVQFPESILADGSRICGAGGTIQFFVDGKVAVYLPWSHFGPLTQKLISRYKGDPVVQLILEQLADPLPSLCDSLSQSLLLGLLQTPDQSAFERNLDVFVSSIKAVRELLLSRHQLPKKSQIFLAAIGKLARRDRRPPTKGQLTELLGLEPSETSRLCKEHGFDWLPIAQPGRRARR